MARVNRIRIDWHAEYPLEEHSEMNRRSVGWRWAVIIGVALLLASGQAVAAETLKPAEDTGGSGGGSTVADSSAGTLDETARAINLAEGNASASTAGLPHYRDVTHVPESQQGAANAARLAEADFVVHPNLRSIQLIEGKEPAVEIARPPSSSTSYSICLSCSGLG